MRQGAAQELTALSHVANKQSKAKEQEAQRKTKRL
jgi:hypothetical protein